MERPHEETALAGTLLREGFCFALFMKKKELLASGGGNYL
jgi:hypothetical protein